MSVELEARVQRLENALITTLIWMGGSANSPLTHQEIQRLVWIVEGRDIPPKPLLDLAAEGVITVSGAHHE